MLAIDVEGGRQLAERPVRAFAFTAWVLGSSLMLIFANGAGTRGLPTSLRVPSRMLWGVTGFTLGLLVLAAGGASLLCFELIKALARRP